MVINHSVIDWSPSLARLGSFLTLYDLFEKTTALLYIKAAFEQEFAQKTIKQAECLKQANGYPLLISKKSASFFHINRCFQRIKAAVFVNICFCQLQAHHVPELCLVQAKRNRTWPGKWEAYYDNGRAHSGYDVVEWAKRGVALGAGEILLMSVDNEGLQRGMDLELIEAVTKAVNVPVICGGGVGCGDDIVDGAKAGADAVACAAVLHYKKETVQELKDEIRAGGVEVRRV